MMTYMDASMQGTDAIMNHLVNGLKFQKVACVLVFLFFCFFSSLFVRVQSSWRADIRRLVITQSTQLFERKFMCLFPRHNIVSMDAQPTNGGILVFVTGHIRVDDNAGHMYFSEGL
jgi:hypothetical protein